MTIFNLGRKRAMSRPVSRFVSRALAFCGLAAGVYQLGGMLIAAFAAAAVARHPIPEDLAFVIEAAGYLAQFAVSLGLSAVIVNHFDDGYDEDRVRTCLQACEGHDTERVRAALRACEGIPTVQLCAPPPPSFFYDEGWKWLGRSPEVVEAYARHYQAQHQRNDSPAPSFDATPQQKDSP